MDNEYLDKVIKASLEQYDAGNAGDSWAVLQDKMDLAPDASFDEIIKNKLNNLDNVYDATTWATLAAALDQVGSLTSIDDLIDSKTKTALEDLDPSYDSSTWEMLENKIQLEEDLSNIEIPEEVDLAAYGSLENLSVPYDENNWEQFQEKLDKEFVLPYMLLFKYKFAEVALLLLFLLGVTQFLPLKKANKIFGKADKHIASTDHQTSKIELKEDTKQLSELTMAGALVNDNSQNKNNQLSNKNIDINYNKKNSNSVELANIISYTSETTPNSGGYQINRSLSNISKRNETDLDLLNVNAKDLLTITSKQASSLLNETEKSENIHENLKAQIEDVAASNEDEARPSILQLASLETLPNYTSDIIPDCIICKNPISLVRWRLSAMINADYNYIMTPYDNVLSVRSYQHAAFGYGAGLATSLGLGRWDIEFGANYVSRKYTPKPISEKVGNILDGYLNFELDKIELNLLNIPLHIRYYFKTEKKTKIFVSGGASLNIAMQANYFKKAEFASRARTPNLSKADQLLEETLINTQKIYSLGFLDGGSFLENRYFTTDLGLGFERKISHRYSIFGQANYQHFLAPGIGPNKDRFNTVSFSAGARALFR